MGHPHHGSAIEWKRVQAAEGRRNDTSNAAYFNPPRQKEQLGAHPLLLQQRKEELMNESFFSS